MPLVGVAHANLINGQTDGNNENEDAEEKPLHSIHAAAKNSVGPSNEMRLSCGASYKSSQINSSKPVRAV